ncbi:MBL fold metallo-hydrolase [Halopiger goleimassiliensis]|uniref:MBL fold metallo-hydrolase n=1 Tax=Halopiger goleimassiliensis TaxID=1293048 RepID=UPI000677DD10|nr:MBL fold metallo-hydrolase [Halopiger goleimassiliensis]
MDRITLGNDEFEGRNNAYVLDGGDDLALVDTGLATAGIRSELREGLADRGYAFADVDAIVLTHHHVDHAALAGEIQAESDATVYVHEADAPIVAGDEDAVAALEERRRELLVEWGVPEEARERLLEFIEAARHLEGEPADVTPIEDGTELEVAGYRLETVHAPGHTAGLCSFELLETPAAADCDGRQAFTGDALLPVYTPNVGGADVRVDRPLATYLETLERLADRGYDRVWPGHRDPIEEPTDRAREIVDHHHERTARILDVLEEHGPCDAWTVSDHLFGDLSGIHVIHGPGEAYAHLDHLHHEGALAYEDGAYRLVDRSAVSYQ